MDFFVLFGFVVVAFARFYLATQVLHVTAEAINAFFRDEDGEGFRVLTLFVISVSPTDHLPCLGSAGLNSAIGEKGVEHLCHGYAIALAELSKAEIVSFVNLYGLKR